MVSEGASFDLNRDHGRKWGRLFGLMVVTLLAMATGPFVSDAAASHFRGGDISYTQTGPTSVDFSLSVAYRRSTFSGTAPDGMPAVGDTFTDNVSFDFGDGTSEVLQFRVDAINEAEDVVLGTALEPGSTTDTQVNHDYGSATGPFLANYASCCTLSPPPNPGDPGLNNNADSSFSVQTLIDLANEDESPIVSVPPVVGVDSNNESFLIQASDAGGETLRYRLATPAEACNGSCSDADPNPSGFSVNATSGVATFDTAGKGDGLYFAAVTVESLNGAGTVVARTTASFLIRIGTGSNLPPEFNPPSPPDGTVFTIAPGQTQTINLQASDGNAGDSVEILNSGIPANSTFSDVDGNPATAVFSFTPNGAQNNQDFIVTFTAQDNASPVGSDFRSYTIRVRPGAPDTDPPDTTITSGPNEGSSSADTTPTFQFTSDEAGSTFECSIDGGPFTACSSGDTFGPLSLGAHTFQVRATDPAGNTDATPAERNFTVVAATCKGEPATVVGTAGNDNLTGTPGRDVIAAGDGNDQVDAGAGDDIVCGEGGNDVVTPGDGDDDVYGEGGNDNLGGGTGRDLLSGASGDDIASGGADNDEIGGDDGNDDLGGGDGNDNVGGGTGNDSVGGGTGNDRVNGSGGVDDLGGGGGNDNLGGGPGVDTIGGDTGNDTISGGGGDDSVVGDAGEDQIGGGTGLDTLAGSTGDDTLLGGPAADTLLGGIGNDFLHGGTGPDTCQGGPGTNQLESC